MWTIVSAKGLCLLLLSVLFGGPVLACGEARFPLRIAAEGTYLEDAAGRPFLITGDAAWSLIADLPARDVSVYIADRKARCFNTVLVSLVEHEFARNAPNNAEGIAPFLTPGDFARPNEPYFSAVENVLDAALEAGMLVLLAPAYLGANGGPQGWYAEMAAAGPEALRSYGRYVGKKYARYPNIVWVQGGDYDPPDRALIEALAEGIEEGAPGAMQTVHGSRDMMTSTYWGNAPWLSLDTVYTYGDTAAAAGDRYRAGPRRPFFLIESRYEDEHGVNASEVRKIAYGALLSGASGQVFGNNPVWHFGGPSLYDAPVGWRAALGSEGAQSIGHLSKLFRGLDWWTLRPDDRRFVRLAEGHPSAFATSSVAADGSFAVIYLSDATSLELDLAALGNSAGTVEWYDPSTGEKVLSEVTDQKTGLSRLGVPRATNAAGSADWFVVVKAGNAMDGQ